MRALRAREILLFRPSICDGSDTQLIAGGLSIEQKLLPIAISKNDKIDAADDGQRRGTGGKVGT